MNVQVGEHTALLPKNEHEHVEGSFKAAVFGFSDGLTTSINLVLGVALFRLFDIWKPWPVRYFDKHVHGGLGIMLDDIVAGIMAWVVLFGVVKFVPL